MMKDGIPGVYGLNISLLRKYDRRFEKKPFSGRKHLRSNAIEMKPRVKFLLVDEPSVGLSPNFVEIIFSKLVEINKAGTSILIVERNARMALEVCHRAYVFDIGKIAFLVYDQLDLFGVECKEKIVNTVDILLQFRFINLL